MGFRGFNVEDLRLEIEDLGFSALVSGLGWGFYLGVRLFEHFWEPGHTSGLVRIVGVPQKDHAGALSGNS